MKVKQLIARLQKMPQDAKVMVEVDPGDGASCDAWKVFAGFEADGYAFLKKKHAEEFLGAADAKPAVFIKLAV